MPWPCVIVCWVLEGNSSQGMEMLGGSCLQWRGLAAMDNVDNIEYRVVWWPLPSFRLDNDRSAWSMWWGMFFMLHHHLATFDRCAIWVRILTVVGSKWHDTMLIVLCHYLAAFDRRLVQVRWLTVHEVNEANDVPLGVERWRWRRWNGNGSSLNVHVERRQWRWWDRDGSSWQDLLQDRCSGCAWPRYLVSSSWCMFRCCLRARGGQIQLQNVTERSRNTYYTVMTNVSK